VICNLKAAGVEFKQELAKIVRENSKKRENVLRENIELASSSIQFLEKSEMKNSICNINQR